MMFGLALPFTSCNKYLDVQPQDKLLESQVLSSETGISAALNGIYVSMATDALYGGNLTLSTIDVLGRQWNPAYSYNELEDYGQVADYNYSGTPVKTLMEAIWKGQYKNIIGANNLIAYLETHTGTLTETHQKIILGEAYGIRAMAHFDLLRLFGPVYATDPTAPSIPYYTKATTIPEPILTAEQAVVKVLADLDKAATLLAEDPIITLGKEEALQSDGKDFYRFRNLRINYYAVKALQARVNIYAGKKAEALAAAKEVIAVAPTLFPWTPSGDILNAGNNGDRVFSSEIIFAVQNVDLYTQHIAYFTLNYGVGNAFRPGFATTITHLNETYEDFRDNDYRFRALWTNTGDQFNPIRFLKYQDVDDKTKVWRFMQPLIRISEMYYIAAEAEPDPAAGLVYLNTVRNNRGLVDLDPSADLETELTKEYRKEFYGEGQIFFYYKRKNLSSIPDGSDLYGGGEVYGPNYVVPLPLSETIYR
jgi:hypothetical protein